jgi:hypothetical protein
MNSYMKNAIWVVFILTIASWFNFNFFRDTGVNGNNIKSDCNQVRAIYLGLLAREPDPSGFKGFCEAYKKGATIEKLANQMMVSEEFKSKR